LPLAGFVKLNVSFPPLITGCGAFIRWFLSSGMGNSAVAMMPVPAAKVPFFVAAAMPMLTFVSGPNHGHRRPQA
jgi:hypothetical protein